eukprot:Sspe_Gene.101347::Locus_75932_Transcript_1_1_Confidence_1.000_Length_2299::g.101347::m.101347
MAAAWMRDLSTFWTSSRAAAISFLRLALSSSISWRAFSSFSFWRFLISCATPSSFWLSSRSTFRLTTFFSSSWRSFCRSSFSSTTALICVSVSFFAASASSRRCCRSSISVSFAASCRCVSAEVSCLPGRLPRDPRADKGVFSMRGVREGVRVLVLLLRPERGAVVWGREVRGCFREGALGFGDVGEHFSEVGDSEMAERERRGMAADEGAAGLSPSPLASRSCRTSSVSLVISSFFALRLSRSPSTSDVEGGGAAGKDPVGRRDVGVGSALLAGLLLEGEAVTSRASSCRRSREERLVERASSSASRSAMLGSCDRGETILGDSMASPLLPFCCRSVRSSLLSRRHLPGLFSASLACISANLSRSVSPSVSFGSSPSWSTSTSPSRSRRVVVCRVSMISSAFFASWIAPMLGSSERMASGSSSTSLSAATMIPHSPHPTTLHHPPMKYRDC